MQKYIGIGFGVLAFVVGVGVGYGISAHKATAPVHDNEHAGGAHSMSMTSMSDTMKSMNAALEGKTGDEFDKAFISEMIVHHQGAVQMAEMARTNAKHQEIKDLSAAIISAQNKEIAQMKAWQNMWYGK